MLEKFKNFIKSVPVLAWVVVGVILTACVIYKVSEANGHPGYSKPVEAPVAGPVAK
jgi:hypothetical protein